MAIVKVMKINDLKSHVQYCLQGSKLGELPLVTCHDCFPNTFVFESSEAFYAHKLRVNTKIKYMARGIIQSFKPNEVEAEIAHEIGVKLAEQYLGSGHHYLVATHVDKEHIHNHIVFGAIDKITNRVYDSKTKHVVHDLREVNNNLCRSYGLHVIENPRGKGISQREYQARKKGNSFKAKLEQRIDVAIDQSNTWDEFLHNLSQECEVKHGKHIAIKQPNQIRFTRLKKLGLNYCQESIRYRIENKDDMIDLRPKGGVLIDKSSDYFQGEGKAALRRWATYENIKIIADLIHEENVITKPDERQNIINDLKQLSSKARNEVQLLDEKIEVLKEQTPSMSLMNALNHNKRIVEQSEIRKRKYKEYLDLEHKINVLKLQKTNLGILNDKKEGKPERSSER